jgi:hypothetical protein
MKKKLPVEKRCCLYCLNIETGCVHVARQEISQWLLLVLWSPGFQAKKFVQRAGVFLHSRWCYARMRHRGRQEHKHVGLASAGIFGKKTTCVSELLKKTTSPPAAWT